MVDEDVIKIVYCDENGNIKSNSSFSKRFYYKDDETHQIKFKKDFEIDCNKDLSNPIELARNEYLVMKNIPDSTVIKISSSSDAKQYTITDGIFEWATMVDNTYDLSISKFPYVEIDTKIVVKKEEE